MKNVAGKLKLDLAQYRELEQFAQVTTDLPEELKRKLIRGKILIEILKQENNCPLTFEKIFILLFAANNGFFDEIEIEKIKKIEAELINYLETNHQNILDELRKNQEFNDSIIKDILMKFFNLIRDEEQISK